MHSTMTFTTGGSRPYPPQLTSASVITEAGQPGIVIGVLGFIGTSPSAGALGCGVTRLT